MYNVRFMTYTQNTRLFTQCELYENGGERPTHIEIVVLHPKEQHNKAKGQKYALAKTLKNLPRAERKQYWDEFFNRSRATKKLINQ